MVEGEYVENGHLLLEIENYKLKYAFSYKIEKKNRIWRFECDFGGYSFDASVVRYKGEKFICLDSNGSRNIGGANNDDDILEYLQKRFREAYPLLEDFSLDELGELRTRINLLKA